MRYLHTAIRVTDLDAALHFYRDVFGLQEVNRFRGHRRPCTIVFLAAPGDAAQVEVVHYDDPALRARTAGFSHIAYEVDDIYAACEHLLEQGAELPCPPRDGFLAFVRSPDGISFELLQKDGPLPEREPWRSMPEADDW